MTIETLGLSHRRAITRFFDGTSNNSIFAERYGVKADGTAQNANIQNAINASPSTGSRIVLPKGQISLDATKISINSQFLTISGQTASGTGSGTELLWTADPTTVGFECSISSGTATIAGITFENIKFTGPGNDGDTGGCIKFESYPVQCWINHCGFSGFGGHDIEILGGLHCGIYNCRFSHNVGGASTGSCLRVSRHSTLGQMTSFVSHHNYFASTEAGGPMCFIQDCDTFLSSQDIIELDQIDSGTAQSPFTASTLKLATSAEATTDFYKDMRLKITGGTGSGQEGKIASYTSGRVATMENNWTTTPDATSTYTVGAGGYVFESTDYDGNDPGNVFKRTRNVHLDCLHTESMVGYDARFVDVPVYVVTACRASNFKFEYTDITEAEGYRHGIEAGTGGEPIIQNPRQIVAGGRGVNDFNSNAALQIHAIKGQGNVQVAGYRKGSGVGNETQYEAWAQDTGGTARQLGEVAIRLTAAHASQPAGSVQLRAFNSGGALRDVLWAHGDGGLGAVIVDPNGFSAATSLQVNSTATGDPRLELTQAGALRGYLEYTDNGDILRIDSDGHVRIAANNGGVTWEFQTDGSIVSNAGPEIHRGSGTPESVVTAPPGSLYLNSAGGANVSIYVKESGTGNTGWVAK